MGSTGPSPCLAPKRELAEEGSCSDAEDLFQVDVIGDLDHASSHEDLSPTACDVDDYFSEMRGPEATL